MKNKAAINRDYEHARDIYAETGVDTDMALETLAEIPLSLPCWQGDDIQGFESRGRSEPGGGVAVTGGYPGRARNADELRRDLGQALQLIPGRHRIGIHAIYGEFGPRSVERDEIDTLHFKGWMEWASGHEVKLDFHPTCFGHPKADSGFTLAHPDNHIRDFWVRHVKKCRVISADLGKKQQSPCLHNLWIPDGYKDIPVDRAGRRLALIESLDEIFKHEYPDHLMKDSLESKLFGIGSEAFVAGSHEFYLGYALTRKKMICLDTGHFHPTESIVDKISALLPFMPEINLHISRGIRWDSDHVPVFSDEVRKLAQEIVRCKAWGRVHFGLDFFDASINRVGAWVLGARSVQKALLAALLEPTAILQEFEDKGNYLSRLVGMEAGKTLPLGTVWDMFCLQHKVPCGQNWLERIKKYEREVLSKREKSEEPSGK